MTLLVNGITILDTGTIADTQSWFEAAGQLKRGEVNVRQAAFYLGMQLEELMEKLDCIKHPRAFSFAMILTELAELATDFKSGNLDRQVEAALRKYPEEFLDADLDILWVTIGAATAQGADPVGGYHAVTEANWDKFKDGVVRDEVTGKIIKPVGWKAPDLNKFIHASLRQERG